MEERLKDTLEAAKQFVSIVRANEEGHSWGAAFFGHRFDDARTYVLELADRLEGAATSDEWPQSPYARSVAQMGDGTAEG